MRVSIVMGVVLSLRPVCVIGIILGIVLFLEIGPDLIHADNIGGLVWGTIILSVVVIIPLGAVFVNLLVKLGA